MRRMVVAVLVLASAIVGCGGSDGPENVALALIDDWNSGDVAALFEWFADDATVYDTPIDAAGVYSDLGFYMGLGQMVVVEECTPVGDDGVKCSTTVTDELSGPLGVETAEDWLVTSSAGQVTNLSWEHPADSSLLLYEVARDAVMWVREAHPDVFNKEFKPHVRCDPGDYNSYPDLWCSSIEGAAELLRLADEFRAQYDL